jgi:hypothetical protein
VSVRLFGPDFSRRGCERSEQPDEKKVAKLTGGSADPGDVNQLLRAELEG